MKQYALFSNGINLLINDLDCCQSHFKLPSMMFYLISNVMAKVKVAAINQREKHTKRPQNDNNEINK